jgi:hypothetical protein
MSEDDGIYREVDEAVRHDKLQALWGKIGSYVVWLTVGVIALTIAYVAWTHYLDAKKEKMTLSFYDAVDLVKDGNVEQARALFQTLSTSGNASFEALSKIWLIKLHQKDGDPESVRELALEFSKDTNMPKHYREWFHIYLNGNHHKGDLASDSSFYRFTEMEQQALFFIKENKLAEAAQIYHEIANQADVPPSMRQRAEMILKDFLPALPDSTTKKEAVTPASEQVRPATDAPITEKTAP